MSDRLIVSSSGVRGIFGSGLTPEVAARYAAAFGTRLQSGGEGGGVVLLGRDSRTSGRLLADAAAAGLLGTGLDVRDLGICPTPSALLATADDPEAVGALIVTASHNPAAWNGLKLGGADGRFVSPETGREVHRLFEDGPAYAGWDGLGTRREGEDAVAHHVERILGLSVIDVERIAARRFHVAVDCVRGAGGRIMPGLLERLGCRVTVLDGEPDGRFPRDPEPTADHLSGLGETVVGAGADLGLAVDPDVDRLSLVDGAGRAVGEDWTLALAVELVSSRRGGPVVSNLSSSLCIRDAAVRAGAEFHQAPVGEANVARAMEEVGAVIGGEGNGGVMLPELHLTRDAPLAAALVLQLLADRDNSVEGLLEGWPRYCILKRKLKRPDGPIRGSLERLRRAAPDRPEADWRDGLRLAWADDRWLHARPSGTEPILRVVAEAADAAQAAELVDWAEGCLRESTGRYL